MSSVHVAAIFDEVALLETLLDKGLCNINADDGMYGTPLVAAIQHNSPSAVELLVQRGANVDYVAPSDGCTALHCAAFDKNTRMLELILPNTRNIDCQDHFRTTPLLRAVRERNLEAARLLLDFGARIYVSDEMNVNPLHGSVVIKNLPLVKLFLEYGADPNIAPGDFGGSASLLYLAMGTRNQETESPETLAILEELIKAGIDININEDGMTPLRHAIRSGAENTAKLFVAAGADLHVRCKKGCTMIHDAVEARNSSILRTILEALNEQQTARQSSMTDMITIDSFDGDGSTPFHVAVILGNTDAAEQLLDFGADINKGKSEEQLMGPLASAIIAGKEDVITLLLKQGADTSKIAGCRFFFRSSDEDIVLQGMIVRVEDEKIYELLERMQSEVGWQEREFKHNPTLQDLLERCGILVENNHVSEPDLEPTDEVLSTLSEITVEKFTEYRVGTRPGTLKWA